MPLALIALLLLAGAAQAQEPEALIDRPITPRQGALDLTLHGTYTNWGPSQYGPQELSGETLALSADYAVSDRLQLGLGVALPIHPGAGFGSILASAVTAVDQNSALRVDFGFENVGLNGDAPPGNTHSKRYFGGFGGIVKVPISATVAFVVGRTGTVQFGHFNNIGDDPVGLYLGSTFYPQGASDNLTISGGDQNGATVVGINLPAGLLLQADPHLAFTVQAGYSVAAAFPSSGDTQTVHFIPLSFEAIATLAPALDVGLRFFLDGQVAATGGAGTVGYFDLRALMLWFRFRVG